MHRARGKHSRSGRSGSFSWVRSRANGFTLIEAVVSLVIIGIIAAVAGSAIAVFVETRIEGERAYQHIKQRIAAMNWIFHRARETGGTVGCDGDELVLGSWTVSVDPDGVVEVENGSGATAYLASLPSGGGYEICDDVADPDLDLIRINLGGQETYLRGDGSP